ncbi:aminopeptidase [Hyphobacterium sp. CCMP332]|nr:aminopeptidase [Hyphobacterium sp. CCMP332]
MAAQELDEVLVSDEFPDSLKIKLKIIREIKEFSNEHLGYEKSENYTTVYDQKGKDILWIVTACPEFELKAYEWRFPLFGTFPYKGFFDLDVAFQEAEKIKEKGYDTNIRSVSGWSTLGWFKDPILSRMLEKSEGDLANTIIHELTHSEIFIKDEIDINENLATFVGDYGALKYLELKYGKDHRIYFEYFNELEEEKEFTEYVIEGAKALDSLYNTFDESIDSTIKSSLKRIFIDRWVTGIDTLKFKSYRGFRIRALKDLPNNTFFMSYLRYNSMQNSFEQEYLASEYLSFQEYVDTLINRYAEN